MSAIEDANRRAYVEKMYPGPGWKKRVKKMTDAQVFAIWKREQDKPKKSAPKRKESDQDEAPF